MQSHIRIGLMQGRLLPKYKDRYQGHPVDTWQLEFERLQQCGFKSVEWVFDPFEPEQNPLFYDDRLVAIQDLTRNFGVKVGSVCATYFMEHQLSGEGLTLAHPTIIALERILKHANKIGSAVMVIPALEQASVEDSRKRQNLVQCLRMVEPVLQTHKVKLAFEFDLTPAEIRALLDEVNSPYVGYTYDIGNAAAEGEDPAKNLPETISRLFHVHIKDRPFKGGNVPLGTGGADFSKVFKLLIDHGYKGDMVMEAHRGQDIVGSIQRDLKFVKEQWHQAGGGAL